MRWKVESKDPHAWKPFFCLIPRRVQGITGDFIVWLEWIERRWVEDLCCGYDFISEFDYRLPR